MPKDTSGLRRGGGRPKGVLNKVTHEVRELAQTIVNDPVGLEKMRQLYRAGRLNPTIVTRLFEYAYGKPKETIALEGQDGTPLQLIQRVVIDVRDPED